MNLNITILNIAFYTLYVNSGNIIAVLSFKLPKGFVQCKISNSTFDECVRDGMQNAIPHLALGVPSLGLIKMDPLRILTLEIRQSSPSMNFELNFKDLDIINMKTLIVKKAHYDAVNYSFSAYAELQKPIILKGLYQVNGKVLILPIVGNGKCVISLDDFKITGLMKLSPIVKNKKSYLVIKKLIWKFTTSKLHVQLDNLFKGNRALGDQMNVFLNRNWRELLKEMQTSFEEVLGLTYVEILQQFFNRVPLNQIFKD